MKCFCFFLIEFFIYSDEQPQVNIAPTLSVLLGIPIPADNVGQVIVPLLSNSYDADLLYALYYNAYQVVTKYLQNGGTILHG